MITRRKLLYSGAALTGAGLFAPLWASSALAQDVNSAASDDIESLRQLSMFLLERQTLDATLSLRILAQCTQSDPQFPDKMKALWSKVGQHHLRSVSQLSGSPFYRDSVMKDTVQKIVSAWYLGYTGTPVSLRATDGTRLVTFTGALAYEPTTDATVIPTYSRGKTNYWVNPPATLAND
ncbi:MULTISPECIES: sorbitol dehydrogenase family protein [unclassified Pseudomonas]|uniref:sorbitol dehydrogenase family protein n=1 Tax=unclassified Pseudomonas TaxID=196821 RepID=UPI002114AB75|nr:MULTISPECIES: sorbitol dehydrogenase family protein [unclassified Pseudomonas]